MPKILFSFILFILHVNTYSQETKLFGNWILVRTLYDDLKPLEINHPDYSQSLIYEIRKDHFKVNGVKNEFVEFKNGQIDYPLQTINYSFKDDYLITQIKGSNLKHFFLKREDLLKKHPDLIPSLSQNKDYIYDNAIANYSFEQNVPLESYLIRELNQIGISPKNKEFEINFILNSSNKIENIKIEPSSKYDETIIELLTKSEKFFKNNTDQNLLISKNINLDILGSFYLNSSIRRIKDEIEDNYKNNNFKKVIELSPKFNKAIEDENENQQLIKSTKKLIAISYLATGKTQLACFDLFEIGGKSDFSVRNYFLDFCKDYTHIK
ncbi:hypothetical protein [Faecalibacter bovis]|uniref:Uncharacterized protein n=1 Tax=Faecalibacter bovis TaxID=2898187 RepID=A0ABX7XGK9_9FLAO|nr:hypothetical protein [Faecalibacter bovis]MBS7333298.1 hypothetical protein [Weeksellaceae bacterium]QTV06724.1 hypothetical protein J9309_05260 [Faecalibacter bovis]